MKKSCPFIIAVLLSFSSFAQTASEDSKPDYHQLVTQGLVEGGLLVQPLYSFQIKEFEVKKSKVLEYAEKGKPFGLPVIFLHGLGDSWHSFEYILPLLPEAYHAFAITQRGHGNSGKNFDSYRIKDFAGDIAAFITELNLGQVIIVGHSMGGVVAQQLAVTYPGLVKALVLVDSEASFKGNPGLPEFYAEIMKLTEPVDKSFMDAFQKSTLAKPIEQDFYNRLVDESLKVPAKVFKASFQGLINTELLSSLKNINKPMLLLWGDKDLFCSLAGQEAMRNMTNGKLIVYPNTGHALHWEEPQHFVQDLNFFIKDVMNKLSVSIL